MTYVTGLTRLDFAVLKEVVVLVCIQKNNSCLRDHLQLDNSVLFVLFFQLSFCSFVAGRRSGYTEGHHRDTSARGRSAFQVPSVLIVDSDEDELLASRSPSDVLAYKEVSDLWKRSTFFPQNKTSSVFH